MMLSGRVQKQHQRAREQQAHDAHGAADAERQVNRADQTGADLLFVVCADELRDHNGDSARHAGREQQDEIGCRSRGRRRRQAPRRRHSGRAPRNPPSCKGDWNMLPTIIGSAKRSIRPMGLPRVMSIAPDLPAISIFLRINAKNAERTEKRSALHLFYQDFHRGSRRGTPKSTRGKPVQNI